MEKFSAYRDPGTGIQPFLTPIPPSASHTLINGLLPLRFALGVLRSALILILLAVYVVLVPGACSLLVVLPFVHRYTSHALIAVLGRLSLFILGVIWISVEQVPRKRGKGIKSESAWSPRAGDIIISNWTSWLELIWLAVRFNPIFVLPISQQDPPLMSPPSTPVNRAPGRRNTPLVQATQVQEKKDIPVTAFKQVSLLSMISLTGYIPSSAQSNSIPYVTLEEIRKKADRPLAVFPECTTSNGRALMRFSDVFLQDIPVKKYRVFLMCFRYDVPTVLNPSATHCIPDSFLNPLPHLFKLATSLKPIGLSVRLLPPSESPSSPIFMTSDVMHTPSVDPLAEASSVLIAQMGKMKRLGMGWEDKGRFLNFYNSKHK
ncbi:hypothetical protein AMATHDRAFT_74979 [Amanita thiersii Skay4041]|uniref:Phospholipid/glycerol acyltransferase domain-containing protein n=1 Tax=Amanita thiersii Skay4041 TaxID=703135 RepID=A0A2A9NLL2_9AGAR|nr:hypothetical protein AMATHDRAFT_74979 [Amanita thiersii Skay4041]